MNYTLLMPSLEHIALVKIVTALWNQDDIRALMSKLKFGIESNSRGINQWQEIENEVIKKVPQLSLPKSLKEEIIGFIKPVGLQISKWINYDDENCYLDTDLPNKFCWTPQGTVDLKRMVETLIKDESLSVTSRYKLACIYCLEDDVLELWNKIPKNQKTSFYWGELYAYEVEQHNLVIFWTYDIKGEVNDLENIFKREMWQQERRRWSPYQYAFETSAEDGNTAATEYFLQKLTSMEREESLVRTAGEVASRYHEVDEEGYQADVLCFLLSQMNEEQQIEVFKRCPGEVLRCLLDWPWQSLFMETANRMWEFLSEEDYEVLLEDIVDKEGGYKDYDYQQLFREFWQQSPNAHKRSVIDKCAKFGLLAILLEIEDKEKIKLILKDATLIEKRKIIFSHGGQCICLYSISGDEWDFTEFFIRECISSKDDMIKFKEEFEERITGFYGKKDFAGKKYKFFQLLDDLIYGYNKRKSVAEGDTSVAKRLHSTEYEEVTHTMNI